MHTKIIYRVSRLSLPNPLVEIPPKIPSYLTMLNLEYLQKAQTFTLLPSSNIIHFRLAKRALLRRFSLLRRRRPVDGLPRHDVGQRFVQEV